VGYDAGSLIGKRLGLYHIERLLGQGAMGSVYLASDVPLQRDVALKVIHPRLLGAHVYVQRFLREARAAARLNHPNIVQIYTAGTDQDLAYLALELVRGGSVSRLEGPQKPGIVARIGRDAARGLAAAHQAGIVHRDIKPDNMLLAEDRVKLTDFGIARVAELNTRITRPGAFIGTPRYSSPEQCRMEDVDARSDLYSLGVVCYELLVGLPPHTATTPILLLSKIATEPPPPIAEARPGVPEALALIIHRLLEKDPEARYPDATALAEDLDRFLVELPDEDTRLEDLVHDVVAELVAKPPLPRDGSTEEVFFQMMDAEGGSGSGARAGSGMSIIDTRAGSDVAADSPTLRPLADQRALSPKARAVIDNLAMAERLAGSGHAIAALRAVAAIARELAESQSTCRQILALGSLPESRTGELPAGDPILLTLRQLTKVFRERGAWFRPTETLNGALECVGTFTPEHREVAEELAGLIAEAAKRPAGEADPPLHPIAIVPLKELGVEIAVPWTWDELPGACDDALAGLDAEGRQQVQAAARVVLGLVAPEEQSELRAWNEGRRIVPGVSLAQIGSIQGGSAGLTTLLAMVAARLGVRPRRGLAATGRLDAASIPSLPPPGRFAPSVHEAFLAVRIARVDGAAAKVRAIVEQRPDVKLCLVPAANRSDLPHDAALQRALAGSDFEIRFVETVRDVFAIDLFDEPLIAAPLRVRGAPTIALGALQRWTTLARLQVAAALLLLLLTVLEAMGAI
jgi:serine/threonine-protein kinase